MFPESYRKKIKTEIFNGLIPSSISHESQRLFFSDMYDLVLTDTDTSKVTVIPARCGVGKSTFVKVLAATLSSIEDADIGMILITDSLVRIHEWKDISSLEKEYDAVQDFLSLFGGVIDGIDPKSFERNVAVITSEYSIIDQMKEQKYKPIVIMTTQRYFGVDADTREQFFSYLKDGKKYKRSIVIIDEKPVFCETIKIGIKNLNDIDSALQDGLDNSVEEKQWICGEFQTFRTKFLDLINEKEKHDDKNNYMMYCKPSLHEITNDDERFFRVIKKYASTLYAISPNVIRELQAIKMMISEGAFFYSSKRSNGSRYEKGFGILFDNKDLFYLNSDRKFFVFDATANSDPMYENQEYLRIVDCRKYNQSVNMVISPIYEYTSKTSLVKDHKATIQRIKSELAIMKVNEKETALITYKNYEGQFKEFPNRGHFGALRGMNNFRDYHQLVQIGVYRKRPTEYLFEYCGSHKWLLQKIMSMDEEKSLEYINQVITFNDKETGLLMQRYIAKSLITDFIQNVFRLAIRDYNDNQMARVWLFCPINGSDIERGPVQYRDEKGNLTNNDYLIQELNMSFADYEGVRIENARFLMSMLEGRIIKRKNAKGDSYAQKIMKCISAMPENIEFTRKTILEKTGLTAEQYKSALKCNKALKKLLDSYKDEEKSKANSSKRIKLQGGYFYIILIETAPVFWR